jgi:hypothetical protein
MWTKYYMQLIFGLNLLQCSHHSEAIAYSTGGSFLSWERRKGTMVRLASVDNFVAANGSKKSPPQHGHPEQFK